MVCYCEDCGFLFQRAGEVRKCPSCEGFRFRSATEEETARLRLLLMKEKLTEKEDNTA